MPTSVDDEVDANFDAFQGMLSEVLVKHQGEYALLRDRKIEGFYATLRGALDAGLSFSDQLFSIQEVTDRPADLGLFSHAINTRLT